MVVTSQEVGKEEEVPELRMEWGEPQQQPQPEAERCELSQPKGPVGEVDQEAAVPQPNA
jgi:hypothetical protein